MGIFKIDPGVSGYMNLTTSERETIQHVERFGASLSLVGVSLIFITYALFKRLRTVPNTFILFASIANVGASVAALIGYDGIMAGDDSALCQIQAFLLEMFMQSDPWWSLAMAVNVFLVFFMAASPNSFRKYLWVYAVGCFGLPGLPALICLVYAPYGERIYGNATLWCWIGDRHNQLRIFLYYIPIWACSSLSALIYLAVGYRVFRQRNQLRNLTLSNQAAIDHPSGGCEKGPAGQGSYGTVTTEVKVTAESSESQSMTPPASPAPSITAVLATKQPGINGNPWPGPGPEESGDDDDGVQGGRNINSLQSLNCGPGTNNPFTTISSVSVSSHPRGDPSRSNTAWARFMVKLGSLDPVKLAYLRTSFVFAISILITWTPSSINRVYSFAHPTRTSYTLNLASAVVLPLQGVWNAVIFFSTSWAVARRELADFWYRTVCWARPSMRRCPGSRRLPSHDTGVSIPVSTMRRGSEPWPGRHHANMNMHLHPGYVARNGSHSPRMSNVRVMRGGSL